MTLHQFTSNRPGNRQQNRALSLTTAWTGWGLGAWVLLSGTPIALAQSIAPAPDGTGTRVTVDGNRIDIGGGSRSGDGANLFHSFQQFNLNSNEIANFLATPDLRNILGRVVGGDPSRIDGLIQVTGGSPNLFLINPAGLIFGPNARLDVPGSFTATSATGIGFGDRWLNGIGSNDYTALVGDPTGFAFAVAQPGAIFNAGNLSVPFGQNLSLVGGTVLSVGHLSANGGRLTVTAVPGESFVRLTPEGSVLALDLPTAGRSGVALGAQTLGPIVPRSIPELLAGQPVTANGLTINPDGSVVIGATSTPTQAGDISVRSAQAGTATLSASNNLFLWASQISITGDLNLLASNAIVGRDAVTLPIQISAGGQLLAWGDQQLDLLGLNHPASQLSSQGNLILSSQGRIDGNIPLSTNSQIFATTPTGESAAFYTVRQPLIFNNQTLTFTKNPSRVQRLTAAPTLFRPITISPIFSPIGVVLKPYNGGSTGTPAVASPSPTPSPSRTLPIIWSPGVSSFSQPNAAGGRTLVPQLANIFSSNPVSQAPVNSSNNLQNNPIDNSSASIQVDNSSTSIQSSLGLFPTTIDSVEVPPPEAITINSPINPGDLQGVDSKSFLSSAGFVEVSSLPDPSNISSSSILSAASLPAPPSTPLDVVGANPPINSSPVIPDSVNPTDLQATHRQLDHFPDRRQSQSMGILDLVALRTDAQRSLICQEDLRRQQQLPDRLDCERKILARTRQSRNYQQTQIALIRLGAAYYEAGRYPQALEIYQESQSLAVQQSDMASQALATRELGNVASAIGEPKQAIEYYQRALKLTESINDPGLKVAVLNSLALVLINQKDYEQAEQQQRTALALAREHQDVAGEAWSLTQLGLLHYQQAQYPQAIAAHQDSLTLAKKLDNSAISARALDNLGLAFYAQKDFEKAAIAHTESLKLARALGDVHHTARALTNLGDTQFQLGQLQPAAENLEAAIQTWETIRKQLTSDAARLSIFEIQETTYSTLQTVLIADHRYERALEMDERGRAQALLKLLSQQRRQSPDQPDQNAAETARSPRDLGTQIDLQQIRQVARDQAATLITYSIERITIDHNQKREIADIAINIWVVKPSGEVHFRQVPLNPNLPLREQIPIARSFLASRLASRTSRGSDPVVSSRALTPGLRQLDRYLIEPIADLLPQREGDRLIFMPHQDLFLVPFSALQNAQGRYLIERYSLAVAPSIQVLDRTHARANQLRQRGNQAGQPLIVGNPVMPLWPAHLGKKSSDRPAPLPNSESEARAVAQMLNVQPLTGANATKNAVLQRLEQASLIHLATHGILDSERGLDSAIALAPMNDGDDGWLTARELLNLDLNAQLVVLSACNTGQGALSGDGIIGLSRSLLAAGVPSAIVTQWAVPDAPTAALMTRFYEFLGQGLDKAAALRQATLATMQQYPDPIDWAAFTLIGDTH